MNSSPRPSGEQLRLVVAQENQTMQEVALESGAPTATRLESATGSLSYKRPFDLVVGLLLLLLLAPVGILVALLVRISSPGPILFRQERIGLDGRPFTLYKFRTMRRDADTAVHEEYFKQYLQGSPAPNQGRAIYKMHRDPRITPCGGFLRRLALDEVPQILNVIKGEMSIVGPRPPLPYEVQLYGPRDRMRLAVKPGMTGLWQIKGRDTVGFSTMVDLDMEYIRRQSLHLDLGIVLATGPALIWAYIKR